VIESKSCTALRGFDHGEVPGPVEQLKVAIRDFFVQNVGHLLDGNGVLTRPAHRKTLESML
jgi:hypothetical protein